MQKMSRVIWKLNPLTKILAVFVFGMISLIFPTPWFGFIILFFLSLLAIVVRLFPTFFKIVVSFGIPLTVMLVFIQGFYSPKNRTVLFDFGFAQLGVEGTFYALKLVSTVLVFMGAFFLMNQTTSTSELVAALVASGVNAKWGYLVLASLNVVPQMNRRMKIIKEAQESRGVDMNGSIIHRVKTILPLIGPVVLSSFTDAQERGMTLETRGFGLIGVKPTTLKMVNYSSVDRAVRIILLASLISVILFVLFIN